MRSKNCNLKVIFFLRKVMFFLELAMELLLERKGKMHGYV